MRIRVIPIEPKFFADFKDGLNDEDAIKAFEYTATFLVIQYIEQLTDDDKWAITFPPCIDSKGRGILHDIGNYFALGHHSTGTKKENRCLRMYPRS